MSGNSGNALKNTFFPPENVPELTTMTEAGEMTSSGGGNHREGDCLKTFSRVRSKISNNWTLPGEW